ncbi:hypothetical protein [Actinoplanes awajinensis]|uniref:hypothetical protein n=1 Tax=Actinoplanes awajinensis TaxID=135946 RepID=UPI000836C5E4|nr:hypothetical protein [Actinoplanes awajinensis]
MLSERTRALLAPADPARGLPVPPPLLAAHDLIVKAEQEAGDTTRRAPRVGRRLVLASAAVVAAATAVAAVHRDHDAPATLPTGGGLVVRPVAYAIPDHPPAAAKHLRELADRIGDAPWDTVTGLYTFHHVQEWGTFGAGAEGGRYYKAAVDDHYNWFAADGAGRWVWKHLPAQYRDEASRAYFEAHHDFLDQRADSQGNSAPWNRPPLPTGTAALSSALDVAEPSNVPDRLTKLYTDYAVPRATRAHLLRLLAGLSGYSWRGPVLDRAGRAGVAVTYQPPYAYQELLIFDPGTGALLAHETLSEQGTASVSRYVLILETRLTATTR